MGRLNYQDDSGMWQPIDLKLVEDNGDYGLTTRANDLRLRLSGKSNSDRLAELRGPRATIRLRQLERSPGLPVRALDRVRIPGRPGQGEVSLIPVPEGLEFTVTLADATLANTYQFVLDTGGLTARLADDGRGVLLLNGEGEIAGTISPPWAIDASDSFAPEWAVTTTLSKTPDVLPPTPTLAPTPQATPAESPSETSEPSPSPDAEEASPSLAVAQRGPRGSCHRAVGRHVLARRRRRADPLGHLIAECLRKIGR
jgi:hypothetical protein